MLLGQRGHKVSRTAVIVLTLAGLFATNFIPRSCRISCGASDNAGLVLQAADRTSKNALTRRGKSYEIDALEGSSLNCLMAGSEVDLPEEYTTKWTQYSDLKKYGWTRTVDRSVIAPSVQAALDELQTPVMSDKSWQMVVWKHEKASPTDSVLPDSQKPYPATGATYRNLFNCDYGILIAVYNRGPQHVENPVDHGSLVPLRQWSDVQGLEWKTICGTKPLRFVIRNTVQNPETLRDLQKLYGVSTFKGIPMAESPLGDYPGKSFEGDSEQGEAIIGSPNGRGVAFLLYQHKQIFGDKTHIESIKVWNADQYIPNMRTTSGSANLLFKIGNDKSTKAKRTVVPDSGFETSADNRIRNHHSSLRHDKVHHKSARRHRKRQGDYYDKDVERGCELNKLMRQPNEDSRYPAIGTDYHDIEKAGWQLVDSQSINKNHRYSQDVMERLRIPPTTDDSWTFIYWKYEKFSKDHINPKSGKGYRTGGYYSNAYNCNAGMMIAISNNNPKKAQENPALTASDIPVLNKWSDVNALTWREACGSDKPLNYLLRSHVNNDETRNVLRRNVGLTSIEDKDLGSYPGRTFSPDTTEGLALLGAPNGRGGAFMISQHKSLFGSMRQVTRISAWGYTQDPDILFEFGTSEGDIPSEKVDLSAPYDYPDNPVTVPCFVFPCDDSEKRKLARSARWSR